MQLEVPSVVPPCPKFPRRKKAGLPNFQASAWFAFFAPKDVPKPILNRLSDALDAALDDEGVRKRLVDLGGDIPDKSKRGPDNRSRRW